MRSRLIFAVLAVLAAGDVRAEARAHNRVVLVPFSNLGGFAAFDPVMAAVRDELARHGYEVLEGDPVELALEADRVRYLNSVPLKSVEALAKSNEAGGVVVGAYAVADRSRDPSVAIQARLLAPDGTVLWADGTGLVSSTVRGLYGAGTRPTLDRLIPVTAAKLFSSMPEPGGRVPVVAPGSLSVKPRAVRSEEMPETRQRVVVLPVENFTSFRPAARQVEQILLARLGSKPAFDVVEPSELRAAAIAEKLPTLRLISMRDAQRLAKRLDAQQFLRFSVFAFGLDYGTAVPEVQVFASIFDAETGHVLWSGWHQATTEGHEGFLRLGSVPGTFDLADRVVSELLHSLD